MKYYVHCNHFIAKGYISTCYWELIILLYFVFFVRHGWSQGFSGLGINHLKSICPNA